jgi:hypothetical protein
MQQATRPARRCPAAWHVGNKPLTAWLAVSGNRRFTVNHQATPGLNGPTWPARCCSAASARSTAPAVAVSGTTACVITQGYGTCADLRFGQSWPAPCCRHAGRRAPYPEGLAVSGTITAYVVDGTGPNAGLPDTQLFGWPQPVLLGSIATDDGVVAGGKWHHGLRSATPHPDFLALLQPYGAQPPCQQNGGSWQRQPPTWSTSRFVAGLVSALFQRCVAA